MIVFAELLVALAWTFGPNGFLLERQLGEGETLPSAWVAPVAEKAWVVFHGREDWPMAFYVPPHRGEQGPKAGVADAESRDVPRVFLFAPYYLATDGRVAASKMPVDVAEYFFHVLLEAFFDLAVGSAHDAWASARADELMSEVPAAQRLSAYREALGDFGAHMLSIANEISRAARRQAAAGGDVCRTLGRPASLFGHWERSFSGGSYRGGYYLPGPGPSRPGLREESRRALDRLDKERFLREVLRVAWSGDPRSDFEALCRMAETDRNANC